MGFQNQGRVTVSDLHIAASQGSLKYPGDRDMMTLGMTCSLLHVFLGTDWVTQNLVPANPAVARRFRESRSFLGPDLLECRERLLMATRASFLAEHLFNLQDVDGIEQQIEEIRRQHLRSRYDELLAAGLIKRANVPLRFLPAPEEKGTKHPDIGITCPDGRSLIVEVEGKDEETEPSASSLKSTLDHARKQLPSDLPGVIMVRIPQGWAERPDVVALYEEETRRLFRNSGRVIALIWLYDAVHQGPLPAGGLSYLIWRPFMNRGSRFYDAGLGAFVDWLFSQPHGHWTSIQQIAFAHARVSTSSPPATHDPKLKDLADPVGQVEGDGSLGPHEPRDGA